MEKSSLDIHGVHVCSPLLKLRFLSLRKATLWAEVRNKIVANGKASPSLLPPRFTRYNSNELHHWRVFFRDVSQVTLIIIYPSSLAVSLSLFVSELWHDFRDPTPKRVCLRSIKLPSQPPDATVFQDLQSCATSAVPKRAAPWKT